MKRIPKYEIDQVVYAVAVRTDDKGNWSNGFTKVFKCIVNEIGIDRNKVEYYLSVIGTGDDMGEPINEEDITTNEKDLIKIIYKYNKFNI
jgi:hypothetical protein